MADQNTIGGLSAATLLAAIGWLAKRLYDAPRQSEFDRVVKECDDRIAATQAEADRIRDRAAALQAIVDDKAAKVEEALAHRDAENRALLDEISRLKQTTDRLAAGTTGPGSARVRRAAHPRRGRPAGDRQT